MNGGHWVRALAFITLFILLLIATTNASTASIRHSDSTTGSASGHRPGTAECGELVGEWGSGGEKHQDRGNSPLTTNQGVAIGDDENSLKANVRGPTLLEDFILRDKITHFDHERIPERVVHARGSGAHGFFEPYESLSSITSADFLQRAGERVPVFVRFSTVAGGAGSIDLPRDVRGFATRFYTKEGNWDLVGNNIPVFFIQDAMKFPDLVHSVKMEPDRGFPQAASAHRNFWDFISLMPESMHMVMWLMSDRAIPRSLRMIQGFGVNTFRLVNAKGEWVFVKFHWRPKLGTQSVLWDEAMKINGADHDFHRRDLFEAIEAGNFPEWEFGIQVIDEALAATLDFDVLDATKVIPEEIVPLRMIGRLVLDRNADNFFAETEQVAFHPGSVVPGIDFSNDPLLQGRLFSYLDTQLLRLGGPNFHEIPINQPKCPWMNMQRDGFHRARVDRGRVNYSPNSQIESKPIDSQGTIDATLTGPVYTKGGSRQRFIGLERTEQDAKVVRKRSATFADHYTQARLFFLSQTPTERTHIVMALGFELAKVDSPTVRSRMVSHLLHVDQSLASRVATQLGIDINTITPADTTVPPREVTQLSPALSILAKQTNDTIKGRVVGCMVSEGADADIIEQLRSAVTGAGAVFKVVAPSVGKIHLKGGKTVEVDENISGGPSVIFDAVAVVLTRDGATRLTGETPAISWVADAWSHLKIIAYTPESEALLDQAGVKLNASDAGLIALDGRSSAGKFVTAAKKLRIWEREASVRLLP